MFPYGYGSGSVELSQRQLHVKEWHTTKDGHQNVGNEESTCTEMHEDTHSFYMEDVHKLQNEESGLDLNKIYLYFN